MMTRKYVDFLNLFQEWVTWDGESYHEFSDLYQKLDSWINCAFIDKHTEKVLPELMATCEHFDEQKTENFITNFISSVMLAPVIDFVEVEYLLNTHQIGDLANVEKEVEFYLDNVLRIHSFPNDKVLFETLKQINSELTLQYGLEKKWNFYLWLNTVLYPEFLQTSQNEQERPLVGQ
jgi:hypothetical protein